MSTMTIHSFPTQEVLDVCAQYGPSLIVPAGLDPVKVMTAIAAVESGGGDVHFVGHNCGPRHEPAYEVGGAPWAQHAMAPLLVQYPPAGNPPQSPAAMSYGPWQMMFLNFQGCTPDQLLADVDLCARQFLRFFNAFVARKDPQDLAEVGEIWNMGHIGADPDYTGKLQAAYDAA